MTQNMNTVKYIRIIFITLALYMGAISETWAEGNTGKKCDTGSCTFSIADSDIKTDGGSGTGTVVVSNIVHNSENSSHEVTITVTPGSNSYIQIGDIKVQKLVDPSAVPARTKALGIADYLTVSGPNIVVNGSSNNEFTFTVPSGYAGAYIEATFQHDERTVVRKDVAYNPTGHYLLVDDVTASDLTQFLGNQTIAFTGTFEGQAKADGTFPKITGLTQALFQTVGDPDNTGGTVRNIVLDNVTISGSTTVTVEGVGKTATGAIANVATGSARIYNCGIQATRSSVTTDDDGYTLFCTSKDAEGVISNTDSRSYVGGTDYVGGLVGFLDGTARVINCYSYADITSGSIVGGIVGRNNVATTSSNLKTMVMNCMFYGNIKSGNKAPIYNGEIITNDGDANGVNNFNYFWSGASYVENRYINVYNCALSIETRFLQRFEFFRHLLNSNLELAGWWVTGTSGKSEMAKWVLEPSQIGSATPYPILKTSDYYPSVVNIDAENATTQIERNKGGLLGTLTVNIKMGDGEVYGHPGTGEDEAKITTPRLTLNITDKDPDHFNFNYYKVQLPYYNDVGTKNYTGNRVVTGWKIVSVDDGGTEGEFTTGDEAEANAEGKITATPYNFADRKSYAKDLYSKSKRVFNQGAYWDVPEGVKEITIAPYWGKAVYLSDEYWDVTYKNGTGTNANQAGHTSDAMTTPVNVPNVGGGQHYVNGSKYNLVTHSLDNTNGQIVFTSMGNAIASSGEGSALFQGVTTTGHTVYDYAVVLVGNYHQNGSIEADKNKLYTVTSIDLDGDNEPDYSFMLRFNGRNVLHPVRYDFLNLVGLGMAQKSTGGTGTYNLGIFVPNGWFESTNTSLFQFTQFEYEHGSRTENDPLILQGGVMEQWVSFNQNDISQKIPYYHVGGNVWFKEFHRGTHQDRQKSTKHPPISVTGGDFKEFYLTGLYRADFANYEDNLECYINGGRFGIVAGAAQEGAGKASNHTKGNVIWQIQNADINEFYGGGLNAVHPVEGNITTVIEGGYIKLFCGGPKFGDMSSGKTVITTATNCKFDTYFGAGYGGNSYSRFTPSNINNISGDYGTNKWNTFVKNNYKQDYRSDYKGVSVTYTTQYIPMSNNNQNVARLLIDFVSFSLATTHSVTSKLTGCTITRNFYGGGSLGKVDGPVSSTLDGCIVNGNVFGAGYSANKPTVDVMNTGGFVQAPYFDSNLGVYMDPIFPATVSYRWEQREESIAGAADDAARTALAIDKTDHILYTNINLDKSNLGSVEGDVNLTIKGNSVIGTAGDTTTGNVFGGGEQSYVTNTPATSTSEAVIHKVTVNLEGDTNVLGNVFGGGDNGVVEGSTEVYIK